MVLLSRTSVSGLLCMLAAMTLVGWDARSVELDSLLAQAASDPELAPYPHFREHVLHLLERKSSEERSLNVNPYVGAILGVSDGPSVELSRADVLEFFDACSRDGMTILRAMALVGRTVRSTGVLAYLNGEDVAGALGTLALDVGLALPMHDLLLFAYIPVEDHDSSGIQCRFVAVYGSSYEHRFSKQVLNATLKIGTGRSAPYLSPWNASASITTAYVVEGSIVFGDAGVGFVDVEGIGGRKHGVVGALQRVLFFIPRAIDGMVVRDGVLHVNAIMDQRVEGFESSLRFAVHPMSGFLHNPPPRSK